MGASWRLAVAVAVTTTVAVAVAHAKPATPGGAPPDWPGPLPWRVPGPMGFTVDAATFPDSAGHSLDLYLRIPPATLRTLLAGGDQGSQARITAELRSGYRGRRQQAEQVLEVSARDTLGEFGEVVLLRFAAQPGPQKLKVRIEDLKRRPTKLPRMGRSKFATADVSGEFEVPAVKGGRQQSDPEFVWEEQGSAAQGSTAFHRLGRALIPNPERLYGLFSTDLHVAFSATSPDARPWKWRVRVLDERQDASAVVESTATAATRLGAQARVDVSRLPAGGYDLELTTWQEGDPKPLQRVARFSIAWRPETWRRSSGEIQELVHFLLEGNEEDRFVQLQPGEQERWMEDYWRRRDPSPETAINEARESFLKRVVIANQRFGRAGFEPGMFSDMGRVYIRYGEPSEVQKQVMPAGDETLRQVVEELSYSENRDIGGIRPQGLGGDMRPYEVWIYEGEIPVPVDADPEITRGRRHQRLLFLFVDDHGLGDYRLRYSNE